MRPASDIESAKAQPRAERTSHNRSSMSEAVVWLSTVAETTSSKSWLRQCWIHGRHPRCMHIGFVEPSAQCNTERTKNQHRRGPRPRDGVTNEAERAKLGIDVSSLQRSRTTAGFIHGRHPRRIARWVRRTQCPVRPISMLRIHTAGTPIRCPQISPPPYQHEEAEREPALLDSFTAGNQVEMHNGFTEPGAQCDMANTENPHSRHSRYGVDRDHDTSRKERRVI